VPPLKRALAFCAIARPSEFFAALTAAGVEVAERVSFRDHHRYTAEDLERIARAGKQCDAFVTTAKDAVKLDPAMRQKLTAAALLHTATLEAVMEDEATVLAQLRALLM
jgi:tetraacyldisaccharide 4'-kinase